MPLKDHFHGPLAGSRPWESFHGFWTAEIGRHLTRRLPEPYLANIQVHFGGRIEIDVATSEPVTHAWPQADGSPPSGNGVAVAAQSGVAVTPALAELDLDGFSPDVVEVRVLEREGMCLVGAIELVSPRNKDREESRLAFTQKCAAYLQSGVGVVVVDVVTNRSANLHDELMVALSQPESARFPHSPPTYVCCYRQRAEAGREPATRLDVKLYRAQVGEDLPTVPLFLRDGPTVPLELEKTYSELCADLGI